MPTVSQGSADDLALLTRAANDPAVGNSAFYSMVKGLGYSVTDPKYNRENLKVKTSVSTQPKSTRTIQEQVTVNDALIESWIRALHPELLDDNDNGLFNREVISDWHWAVNLPEVSWNSCEQAYRDCFRLEFFRTEENTSRGAHRRVRAFDEDAVRALRQHDSTPATPTAPSEMDVRNRIHEYIATNYPQIARSPKSGEYAKLFDQLAAQLAKQSNPNLAKGNRAAVDTRQFLG